MAVDTTSNDAVKIGSSSLAGNLWFMASSGNYVGLNVATVGTSYTLTLPSTAPSTTNTQCLESPGTSTNSNVLSFVNCATGGHNKNIILTAEYAGAVLDSAGDSSCSSNNTGTMTSGYNDIDVSPQTYYQWSNAQSTSQCYDVVVRVPIPSDWNNWSTVSPPTIVASTTGGSIAVEAIAANTSYEGNYSNYETPSGIGSSLATLTLPYLTGSGATDFANGILTLKIRMTATSSNSTDIGTITIPYQSQY